MPTPAGPFVCASMCVCVRVCVCACALLHACMHVEHACRACGLRVHMWCTCVWYMRACMECAHTHTIMCFGRLHGGWAQLVDMVERRAVAVQPEQVDEYMASQHIDRSCDLQCTASTHVSRQQRCCGYTIRASMGRRCDLTCAVVRPETSSHCGHICTVFRRSSSLSSRSCGASATPTACTWWPRPSRVKTPRSRPARIVLKQQGPDM